MMECAALFSHLVTQSSKDFFRVRVSGAPGWTVVPSRFRQQTWQDPESVAVADLQMWNRFSDFQARL
jgi:hypothetical protein